MGWIGESHHLLYYLSTVGADKGEDGRYILVGAPVLSGLGGCEVVVPDETSYLVDGKRKALAAGLGSTSYGISVKVI
jgi:hypothetical protein